GALRPGVPARRGRRTAHPSRPGIGRVPPRPRRRRQRLNLTHTGSGISGNEYTYYYPVTPLPPGVPGTARPGRPGRASPSSAARGGERIAVSGRGVVPVGGDGQVVPGSVGLGPRPDGRLRVGVGLAAQDQAQRRL